MKICCILHGRVFVMNKKKYCEIGEAGSELHGFVSFMFFGHSSLFIMMHYTCTCNCTGKYCNMMQRFGQVHVSV